jgi:hypothetical protein
MTKEQYQFTVVPELLKGRRLLTPNEANQAVELCHQLGLSTCKSCPESFTNCINRIIDEARSYERNNNQ